jgi:zinc transport system permease protein
MTMTMITTMGRIAGASARGMLDDFLIRAALAGLGVALAAGPLGCFIVWRRMAYFGDATAHAALLGVALALALSISVFAGVLAVALALALSVSSLSARGYPIDTLLGVFAHGGLAIGLVVVSLLPGTRVDLMGILLGDILAVGQVDLAVIWAGAAMVVRLLAWRWSGLLTATLNSDLAQASGIDPQRESLILTLSLAVVVAVALKVVGALLISAMLIIPAATVRPLARSPETMAVMAAVLGGISALGGIALSYQADTPTGPTIVALATGFFIISTAVFRPR